LPLRAEPLRGELWDDWGPIHQLELNDQEDLPNLS
jgi:hypothetical protein